MALTPSNMLPLGTSAPFFQLPDPSTGKIFSLYDFLTGHGLLVMFICNHCPYVKHLRVELAKIGKEFQSQGLAVVAINSNDALKYPDDSPDMMKKEVKSAGYTFPYLFDETQEVAKSFLAACTPDFYLFDKNQSLVYRGQFDSSRPGNKQPITGEDLRGAVQALLNGKSPKSDQKPSIGCNIKWRD